MTKPRVENVVPVMLTVERAARRVDVSARFLHSLIEEQRLRSYTIPGSRVVRVRVDELDQLFVPKEAA